MTIQETLELLTRERVKKLSYVENQKNDKHASFVTTRIMDTRLSLLGFKEPIAFLAHELRSSIGNDFSLFAGGKEKLVFTSSLSDRFLVRVGLYHEYLQYPDIPIIEPPLIVGVRHPVFIDKIKRLYGNDSDVTPTIEEFIQAELKLYGVFDEDLHAGNIRFKTPACRLEDARIIDVGYLLECDAEEE